MFRHLLIAATLAAGLLLTGCASITKGQTQSLSVVSKNNGEDLAGAKCELVNDKGLWLVTTPGSVPVHRSFGDMTVTCKADNVQDGIASVKSSTTGAVFGNILLGGGIGVGIDVATGAAYDYPAMLVVTMGQTTRLESDSPANSRPIDPTEKVPYLEEADQLKYREFLQRPSPRAFAISSNGRYGMSWNDSDLGKRPATDRNERALAACKQAAGQACDLYVVDDRIVFEAKPTTAAMQTPAPVSLK